MTDTLELDEAAPVAAAAAVSASETLPAPQARPMRRGQKLTDALQDDVVKQLAAGRSSRAVARSLQQDHGIRISRMGIERYDPTKAAGHSCTERYAKLFHEERARLDEAKAAAFANDDMMAPEPARLPQRAAPWVPEPSNQPQVDAYHSAADLLLYGGAAGGGQDRSAARASRSRRTSARSSFAAPMWTSPASSSG